MWNDFLSDLITAALNKLWLKSLSHYLSLQVHRQAIPHSLNYFHMFFSGSLNRWEVEHRSCLVERIWFTSPSECGQDLHESNLDHADWNQIGDNSTCLLQLKYDAHHTQTYNTDSTISRISSRRNEYRGWSKGLSRSGDQILVTVQLS